MHVHIAFWMVGAPRLDKIIVPKEKGANVIEVEVKHEEDSEAKPTQEAADLLASFWDRIHTEFNVAKAVKCMSSGAPDDADIFALCEDTGIRQKIGRKKEKEFPSPESISYQTLMHCLLGNPAANLEAETTCWRELDEILNKCARCGDSSTWPTSGSQEEKHALARKYFVAALAEWTNMHDLHRPFPLGPPSKDQPCAAIEHEHSSREKVSCNKLFPRKRIEPGSEEIAEDPRRRGLFRLWLTRNCHFLNNFVPIVSLMMHSNMDFQATLTIDAVIEYMTKYMTKAGQGSLVQVMEHSFSLWCRSFRPRLC